MQILKAASKKTNGKMEFVGLRLKTEEKNYIKMKANLYTGGNITAWMVYCAMNYRPKSIELLEEAPQKVRPLKK